MAKSSKKRIYWRAGARLAPGTVGPVLSPQPFVHDIFDSEAEYDQSVDSVVARIRSGAVRARTPDE